MKLSSSKRRRGASRESGNTFLTAILVIMVLAALTAAHFAISQSNLQQSRFFSEHSALRLYADSGIGLALHDLRFGDSATPGAIGAGSWTIADDLGRDSVAGTNDEGEADGIPTPGEPNTAPVAIGSNDLGGRLLVAVLDTSWARVKRIVSSVTGREAHAAVEAYAQEADSSIPRAGAVYLDPEATLDLNGNVFTISGEDTNPDGSAGPDPAIAAISTPEGDPPGDNETALSGQVDFMHYDQLDGAGGEPSVAEYPAPEPIDTEAIFELFASQTTNEMAPGSYSDVTLGTGDAYQITHVAGDLDLSGEWSGAGVLLVEGDLTMSGQSKFEGLVIVKGRAELSGGGKGIHVFGTLLVEGSLKMAGNADIAYSSYALNKAEELLAGVFTVLYWKILK